jgi:hypothetical protein
MAFHVAYFAPDANHRDSNVPFRGGFHLSCQLSGPAACKTVLRTLQHPEKQPVDPAPQPLASIDIDMGGEVSHVVACEAKALT